MFKSLKQNPYLQLIRPYQWAKNLIILIPAFLSPGAVENSSCFVLIFGMILFSVMASAVYIFNDLLDRPSDVLHPVKMKRPVASGRVSTKNAIWIGSGLMATTLILMFFQPHGFEFLVAYMGLNFLYTLYFKRQPILDIFFLAIFYLLRILYGGVIANVEVSFWLISFSFFIFCSLAFAKRYSELNILFNNEGVLRSSGRSYHHEDLSVLKILGIGTGLLSVMLLILFIELGDNIVYYKNPKLIWGIEAIIFYWISRIWFLASRNKLKDDPVMFAIKDKTSIGCALLCLILGWLSK
jgi:4-hydroxybenzoate polyprenyltransferase